MRSLTPDFYALSIHGIRGKARFDFTCSFNSYLFNAHYQSEFSSPFNSQAEGKVYAYVFIEQLLREGAFWGRVVPCSLFDRSILRFQPPRNPSCSASNLTILMKGNAQVYHLVVAFLPLSSGDDSFCAQFLCLRLKRCCFSLSHGLCSSLLPVLPQINGSAVNVLFPKGFIIYERLPSHSNKIVRVLVISLSFRSLLEYSFSTRFCMVLLLQFRSIQSI